MALVVEDGTIVSGANTLVSAATVVSYASDRGVTMTEAQATVYIYKIMAYYESLSFQGYIVNKNQALMWPRKCVYYRDYLLPSDAIPQRLIDSICEYCIALHEGFDPQTTIENEVKEEGFGPFKVVYKDSSGTQPIIKRANDMLSPFLSDDSSNGIHFKVERGY